MPGDINELRRKLIGLSLVKSLNLSNIEDAKEPKNMFDVISMSINTSTRLNKLVEIIEQSAELPEDLIIRNLTHSLDIIEKVFIFRENRRMVDVELRKPIIKPNVVENPNFKMKMGKLDRINPSSDFKQFLQSEFATKKFRNLLKSTTSASLKPVPSVELSEKSSLINVLDWNLTNLKIVDNWNFDILEFQKHDPYSVLKSMSFFLINKYGLILRFRIVVEQLLEFLGSTEVMYLRNNNEYHNNVHAADTIQTIHFILSHTGIMNSLTDLEIFAIFFAGIILNIDNPGVSNEFQRDVRSEFAVLYNDKNINENRCLSTGFKLLKGENCNIVKGLSKQEYKLFRMLVIEIVLTDMATATIPTKYFETLSLHTSTKIDASALCSNILHLAENGHYGKTWNIHYRWIDALTKEQEHEENLKASKRYYGFKESVSAAEIANAHYLYLHNFFEPRMKLMTLMIEHNREIAVENHQRLSLDESDNSDDSVLAAVKSVTQSIHGRQTEKKISPRSFRKSTRRTVLVEYGINSILNQVTAPMPWDIHIAENKQAWNSKRWHEQHGTSSVPFKAHPYDVQVERQVTFK